MAEPVVVRRLRAAGADPVGVLALAGTRNTIYTLTDQRLKTTRGVFTRTTEDLELYRVRDSRFEQDLAERLLGLGQVVLFTTDETSPEIRLAFIRDAEAVREKIRALVEARRDAKRVRYLDAE